MALTLPRIVVDLSGPTPRAQAKRANILRAGELTWLLGFDPPGADGVSERCIALPDRRWAVARRAGDLVVWRLVDEQALRRLGHPAWLWTRDEWFDPALPEERADAVPPVLPLRNQIQLASALGGNRKRTIKALASTIARLRSTDRSKPIALVAPPQALASASTPARWFALAVLTCLPPALREGLRIGWGGVGWGDAAPDPSRFDVVLCAGWHQGPRTVGPTGFELVDAVEPPGEGDDLVAYYVRNRLHANDPEAVEAAAFLEAGRGPDRWGEGVAELLREGVPGISEVDDEMLERDPEGTVRAISARLRAGATLDDALLERLVQITVRTRDPRPWAALGSRPAVERARAVQALLQHANKLRPRTALVQVLGALYPAGAAIEPWIEALMRWVQGGVEAAVTVLENTLLDWPTARTRATRASIWSEVVRSLVKSGRYEAAMRTVVSPLSRELAREGAARALVSNWSAIPVEARSTERLAELVAILSDAKDGGPAVAMLFRYVRESPAEVSTLIRSWAELHDPIPPDDPLLDALRSSDYVAEWVSAAIARGAPGEIGPTVGRFARGSDDPLWLQAEEAQSAIYGHDPRNRFVALHNLSEGRVALEPRARELIGPAVSATRYPDYELAEMARELVAVADASPIWRWIAISATVPDQFDDGTVDATTVAFCEQPPEPPLQDVALASARALGLAERWEPIDHARWIVRLCLAPDDGTGFHVVLATALVQGIALRPDAVARMAAITEMLLELEPDHPALDVFFRYLLPNAWLGGLPRLYVDAVPREKVPPPLAQAWQALVR